MFVHVLYCISSYVIHVQSQSSRDAIKVGFISFQVDNTFTQDSTESVFCLENKLWIKSFQEMASPLQFNPYISKKVPN